MTEVLPRLRHALADRYSIERELGAGGMATVYLAEDLKHHRQVALKVLRQELTAALGAERFHREIQIAAQLQHPNILPLLDSGEAAGLLYYAMPYVEGQSLRERLAREGALPVPDTVRILRDVVDALTEAHAHGVVHRDIKPENILLRGRHALVTDFGVAKAVSEATGRQTLTTAGVALGTPAYMAPEQASADPHLDHRVDIYAVGAVAYELLTGRPVFMGTTPQMVLSAHVTEAPQAITKYREAVPRALEALVMRCLAKQPADRWQSAEELLPQLEALATPSGGITPTDTQPVPPVTPRRRLVALGAAGAAVVLIAIGVVAGRLLRPKALSITASDLTQVTNEPGVQFEPAISPDGKEVVYVANPGTAWRLMMRSTVSTPGGAALRLNDSTFEYGAAPGWSGDGNLVRLQGCRALDCRWYETDKLGGAARPAPLPRQAADKWVAWSADGTTVAYFVADTLFAANPADTAAPRRIAIHPGRGAAPTALIGPTSLVWSPDGRLIAYVHGALYYQFSGELANSSIWVVNAAGGTPQSVTDSEHANVSPTWLDARHLLFVSDRDGAPSVYVIEVGPRGPRGVAQGLPGIADPYSISYSIAARKLAWAKLTHRDNIWSFPLGRAAPISVRDGVPVTTGNEVSAAADLSLDGKWLAFESNRGGRAGLYRMPVAGGAAIPIADEVWGQWGPRWSPDGTEIAFFVGAPHSGGATQSIAVMPATGGTPVVLTSARTNNSDPVWSPDGLHIGFQSDRTGRSEAWLLSRDRVGGTWHDARQLTDSGAYVRDWPPDGSGVLCGRGSSLFLVSLQKRVIWRRDLAPFGLVRVGYARFSRDGKTVYFEAYHRGGRYGIWAVPMSGGAPHLVLADVEAARTLPPLPKFGVGRDHLYLAVQEYESDIWVANLRW